MLLALNEADYPGVMLIEQLPSTRTKVQTLILYYWRPWPGIQKFLKTHLSPGGHRCLCFINHLTIRRAKPKTVRATTTIRERGFYCLDNQLFLFSIYYLSLLIYHYGFSHFFYLISTVLSAALPNIKRDSDAFTSISGDLSSVSDAIVSVFKAFFLHETLKHIRQVPPPLCQVCPLKTRAASAYVHKQILLLNAPHPNHFIFVVNIVFPGGFQ